eukprot:jgi/Orpsp1_1/1180217/evm.model.c7180000072541.1
MKITSVLLSSLLLFNYSLSATLKSNIPSDEEINETLDEIVDFDKALNLYYDSEIDNIELSKWFNNGLDYTASTLSINNEITNEKEKAYIRNLLTEKSIEKLNGSSKRKSISTEPIKCNSGLGVTCTLICSAFISACEVGFPNKTKKEIIDTHCLPDACVSCYESCF